MLVDPDDLSHGATVRVSELLSGYMDDTLHPFVAGSRILDKLIAEVVKDWSLDLPVPHGEATLLADVPEWAYDALVDGVQEHRNRLDFIRPGRTFSESRTPSEDTPSPDKNPPTEP